MPTENDPAGQLGVVIKNVVPLRREPNDDSEQTSQALIGQPISVEGGQGDWLFVQTWDTYRGWIASNAVRILDDQTRPYASNGPVAVVRELIVDVFKQPRDRAQIVTKATISDELEVVEVRGEWVELRMPSDDIAYAQKNDVKLVDKDFALTIPLPDSMRLVDTALRFVGVPYLWGGTSPFGIDCSGLVQLIYRIHGVTLLRDANMQAADPRAEPIDRNDLAAGDLIFFGSGTEPDVKCVSHVGMALDNKRFIHACGHSGTIIASIDAGHPPHQYWGSRQLRLATLDLGGGVVEE